MSWQKEICTELGLKGRIIIAEEGINGTVEGNVNNTQKYIEYMRSHEVFNDTEFKISDGDGQSFPKLSIKVRNEIVSAHLGDEDVNPKEVTGKYLDPEELHKWFEEGKEFYIVDMRNDYEHKVGYFKNSILPSLRNFRDLPKILNDLDHLKDKTVLTVCTGGVRCEKASGYLVTKGFKDVYQLKGGIVTYMEKYPNQNFLGKLYVFDNRVVMGFNTDSPEHVIVGRCEMCGKPSDHYINCKNDECHRHFICCEDCLHGEKSIYHSENCEITDKKKVIS